MTVGPSWIRGYRRSWLRGDVVAGITVTAYLVPQVMAYADLAGVPAVMGLWAAVGGLTAYALVGTSPCLSAGPESTTALMTTAALGAVGATSAGRADLALALALAVAVICFTGRTPRRITHHVTTARMPRTSPVMITSTQIKRLTEASTSANDSAVTIVWSPSRLLYATAR